MVLALQCDNCYDINFMVSDLFMPGGVFLPPGHITCQYVCTDYLLCLCLCVDVPGTAGAQGDQG